MNRLWTPAKRLCRPACGSISKSKIAGFLVLETTPPLPIFGDSITVTMKEHHNYSMSEQTLRKLLHRDHTDLSGQS